VRLVAPDRGCAFKSAAFDGHGLVATEGCNRGDPLNEGSSHLGEAYLVQLNAAGRKQERIRLKLGLLESLVATIPATSDVLVTENQPANEPYPERDWVWEFDGAKLRPIANYKANDAAQIIAVPW
jgi:hypothetical protein